MGESLAKRGAGAKPSHKLYLLFRIGSERYALHATDVVRVLPRLHLKPIACAPVWVAGVFAHGEVLVPVIDISTLTFGLPAAARPSTRLVLVYYRGLLPDDAADSPGQLLGLILEQATETLRCNPEEFQPYGLDNREAPYLGPVRRDSQGLIQWIRIDALLTPEVHAVLFPPSLLEERSAEAGQ